MQDNIKLILAIIISLAVGLGAGYYYGNSVGVSAGVERGRTELLAEQKKAGEEELAKMAKEANPFNKIEEAVNPFKDVYKNPFVQ